MRGSSHAQVPTLARCRQRWCSHGPKMGGRGGRAPAGDARTGSGAGGSGTRPAAALVWAVATMALAPPLDARSRRVQLAALYYTLSQTVALRCRPAVLLHRLSGLVPQLCRCLWPFLSSGHCLRRGGRARATPAPALRSPRACPCMWLPWRRGRTRTGLANTASRIFQI